MPALSIRFLPSTCTRLRWRHHPLSTKSPGLLEYCSDLHMAPQLCPYPSLLPHGPYHVSFNIPVSQSRKLRCREVKKSTKGDHLPAFQRSPQIWQLHLSDPEEVTKQGTLLGALQKSTHLISLKSS